MLSHQRKFFMGIIVLPLVLVGIMLCVIPGAATALPVSEFAAVTQSAVNAPSTLPQTSAGQSSIITIKDIAFGIIGSLAVLMITISGLKYITSGGDPGKASEAKNGIMYALIGLAIAILADVIVTYVVNHTA